MRQLCTQGRGLQSRIYVRRVRIACDDLHDDPLHPAARAALLELPEEDIPAGGASCAPV
jgi:hypothetical protein